MLRMPSYDDLFLVLMKYYSVKKQQNLSGIYTMCYLCGILITNVLQVIDNCMVKEIYMNPCDC